MNENNIWHKIRIVIMSLIAAAFMVIGFLFFLRPAESDIEKRKLAIFPEPSLKTILNGSFFTDISKWYADTYPLREQMIAFQSDTEEMYGIKDEAIYGDTGQIADEIPDKEDEAAPIISDIAFENGSSDDDSEKKSNDENIGKNITSTSSAKSDDTEILNKGKASSESAKKKPSEDGMVKVQPEVAGTVYIAENRGFTLYYFYKKGADLYASMLNTVAKKIGTKAAI